MRRLKASVSGAMGLAVVLLAGCAAGPRYHVETIEDKFDGHVIDRMGLNSIVGTPLSLNAQRYADKKGTVQYSLIVSYVQREQWLFIEPGETLVFLVDGERLGLVTRNGSRDHREVKAIMGTVLDTERAWYDITLEDLRRVANAGEVLLKLQGRARWIEARLTPGNLANLKRFLEEYGDIRR